MHDTPTTSPFRQPRAVWAVAFACVVSFMGIGLVDPILKSLAGQLHASPTQVELLFTSYLVITAVAMLVTGWVSSRLGPKRTLIVGLVILLMPNLVGVRGFGLNLVVFFGALYAIRGLGVLAWFMKPGALGVVLVVGLVMLITPFLTVVAILGFLTLGITALGLGVGDTWADWRKRARSTLS